MDGEFRLNNDEFLLKNDEFDAQNDEFLLNNDEFDAKTDDSFCKFRLISTVMRMEMKLNRSRKMRRRSMMTLATGESFLYCSCMPAIDRSLSGCRHCHCRCCRPAMMAPAMMAPAMGGSSERVSEAVQNDGFCIKNDELHLK